MLLRRRLLHITMRPEILSPLRLAALALPLACSGNDSESGSLGTDATGDTRLYVPESLSVFNLAGEGKAVNVVALTLLEGVRGLELYASVRNDGQITGCDGAISFELFDETEQSVGSWIGALYTEQLFRRSDGSGGLIACIEPGAVAMAELTDLGDLGEGIAIDDVGTIVYQPTYFDRDILPFEIVPVDALTVTDVNTVSRGTGSAFTGTLENGLEVTLSDATVTIFPLNGVGRPLGVAKSGSAAAVAAGESWTFETGIVGDAGLGYAAYPAASLSL